MIYTRAYEPLNAEKEHETEFRDIEDDSANFTIAIMCSFVDGFYMEINWRLNWIEIAPVCTPLLSLVAHKLLIFGVKPSIFGNFLLPSTQTHKIYMAWFICKPLVIFVQPFVAYGQGHQLASNVL